VVEWKSLDDESAEQYLRQVEFARNLARHLATPELWPRVVLSDGDCLELERRLAEICPALRDEAFLPHWEYAGEHKLPIVPEPLGLVSLSRSERRTDPLATMSAVLWIELAAVAVLTAIIFFPPWVQEPSAMRTVITATSLLTVVMTVFFFRCQGPRPSVAPVHLERGAAGWLVGTQVVNQGRGDGQVEVTFSVRHELSGRSRPADRRVALGPHERVEVSGAIEALEAPAGHCTAKVGVQYPPR
jgi:hypothetical protein